uniref:Cap-specific mRNA (nucleoside-2'-O-)-methyltransferase 1 n=1 Tax=Panstrongylus megistus TaxID=65343 RepID=A0A069DZH7_9HEMI
MGYKSGQGLGKHAQGRVEPVELSKQRGRRGLGLTLPGLDPASLHWDSSYEIINLKEEINWLKGDLHGPLDLETLKSWKKEGPKDMNIEKMTDFCDEKLLHNILSGKDVFDSLTSDEIHRARSRSNPFETLRSGMFLNRAALKMSNMDARFEFMFTNPKYDNGEPMVHQNQLLYFADVCAGPGGFSEYVLWRKKWLAKGFGFTLKGDCDFKLCDFFAGSPETFEPFYGVKDDGNVFDPDNIRSFTDEVMKGTDGKGVHFMMADGGFSVEGQENYQEILSKQLYLCQCLVALCIVRNEGHFICKLFDLFSPFSAGLVYLMYRSFKEICIFKPNTSRPANSERYIVCKHKRHDCTPIKDYMFELCERLWEFNSASTKDITHCVPLSVLEEDDDFCNYLVDSNNRLGERQVVNLMKITAFCRDQNLVEDRQAEMRKNCLALWDIPDKPRLADRTTPEEAARKCGFIDEGSLTTKKKLLKPDVLTKSFHSLYDWHCVPLGSPELHIYLGLGRNKIFRWNPNGNHWTRENQFKAELSPGTILYGEMVPELIGEGRSQKKRFALHVVDAIALGYQNIAKMHYKDRLQRMNLYAAALKKHEYKDKWPVRIKQPVPMEDLNDIFHSLSVRYSKSEVRQLILENEEYWFQPKGILFVNSTKEPWCRFLSKTTNYHYYFHPKTKQSKFDKDRPPDANANTLECIEKQIFWIWEEGVGLQKEEPVAGVVHKDDLLIFISNKLSV